MVTARPPQPLTDGAAVGSDGWVSTRVDDIAVHVHIARDAGTYVVRGVLIESDAEVTTDTLRRVQPARILAKVLSESVEIGNVRVDGDVLALRATAYDDNDLSLGTLRRRTP